MHCWTSGRRSIFLDSFRADYATFFASKGLCFAAIYRASERLNYRICRYRIWFERSFVRSRCRCSSRSFAWWSDLVLPQSSFSISPASFSHVVSRLPASPPFYLCFSQWPAEGPTDATIERLSLQLYSWQPIIWKWGTQEATCSMSHHHLSRNFDEKNRLETVLRSSTFLLSQADEMAHRQQEKFTWYRPTSSIVVCFHSFQWSYLIVRWVGLLCELVTVH